MVNDWNHRWNGLKGGHNAIQHNFLPLPKFRRPSLRTRVLNVDFRLDSSLHRHCGFQTSWCDGFFRYFFSIMLLYFLRTPGLTLTLLFIPKAFDNAVHGVKIKQIRRATEAPEFLEILTLKFPQSSRLFSVHLRGA